MGKIGACIFVNRWICCSLLLAVTVLLPGAAMARQSVLILHSYHKGMEWTDRLDEALEGGLQRQVANAEITVEYMDAKRRNFSGLFPLLRSYYGQKFRDQHFDVILAVDGEALSFLLAYGKGLFPGVPVVFCGVNDSRRARQAMSRGFVGVREEHDVKGTIELALRLFPDTCKIAVVSDDSLSGQANRARLREVAPLFDRQVDFAHFSGMSRSELKRCLAMLPVHSVVLLLGYQCDGDGCYLSAREGGALVADYSDLPVFTTWDFQVRGGVLGGHVVVGRQQGTLAADMAARILQGETPQSYSRVPNGPNMFLFDYAALPEKSVLLNEPKAPERRFPTESHAALGAAGGFMLLVALLVTTLLQRRRGVRLLIRDKYQLDTIVQTIGDQMCMLDRQLNVLWSNEAFKAAFGNQTAGRKCHEILFGRAKPCAFASCPVMKSFKEQDRHEGEFVYQDEKGTQRYFRCKANVARRGDDGRSSAVLMVARDVTESRFSRQRLYLAQYALDSSVYPLCKLDMQGNIVYGNQSFLDLWGYESEQDALGLSFSALVKNYFAAQAALQALERHGEWFGEFKGLDKRGNLFDVAARAHVVKDPQGKALCFFVDFEDVTEKKKAEREIKKLAYFDSLTNLPNRLLFVEELSQRLARARKTREVVGVILVDLDDFKQINDTLGHPVGDRLLQSVAQRMSGTVRRRDFLTRWGGDEFLVMVTCPRGRGDIEQVAEGLLKAINSRPFHLRGTEIYTSASMGVACWPEDGDSVDILIKNADTALYQAKREGRNTWRFFTEELNRHVVEKQRIHARLRRALKNDEFFLVYQPQVDLKTGRVLGVEALLRWRDPQEGLIPPGTFIPHAEANGLILPLGNWVLRSACRQAVAWRKSGLPPLKVAVNVSIEQIRQPDLVAEIEAVLAETGLDPAFLELEITESVFVENMTRAIDNLTRVQKLGISLAIDDFGTGYSSLCYLKNFPIDRIKIAQQFVRDIPGDVNDEAVVEATIAMARSLGVNLIAEGVENKDQVDFLTARQCHEMQGYYFARPMPAAELESCLRGKAHGCLFNGNPAAGHGSAGLRHAVGEG
jgi:diguanylate cyclase (GGDEF)-like protein/PAS domain S-box-containing protein